MRKLVTGVVEIVQIGGDILGIDQKEARVKAARTARRRQRAEHKLQRGRVGQIAALRKGQPIGRGRALPCAFLAKDQAGLFPKLADRGHHQGMCKAVIGVFGQTVLAGFIDHAGQRHLRIAQIDRAAGKDEFIGHEGRCRATLPHQDPRRGMPVADHDHRGCVADFTFIDGHRLAPYPVFLAGLWGAGQLVLPNPPMRFAHWKPIMAPFSLGRR